MQHPFVLPDAPVRSRAEHLELRGADLLEGLAVLTPTTVLELVDASGLRGRGGAWFPTATKWRTTVAFAGEIAPTLVVNAAEGEPGSFKDRHLLRVDPHSVLEGAVLAARAVGADTVVFATKAHFSVELGRLREAIEELERAGREHGITDLPRLEIVEGPDRYLFGEESALLEVVAGRAPFPRISPPWRHGALDLDGRGEPASTAMAAPGASRDDEPGLPPPALVQNVETLARVAHIVRDPHAYEQTGQTFLATVTGDAVTARVAEFPIGVSLRDVLGDDAASTGYVLNGVTYPLVTADRFDLPLLAGGDEPRVDIGAGAFQCYAPEVDPRSIAAAASRFLAVESCGQCDPCKTEGLAIAARLDGDDGDLADALAIADELTVRAERVTVGARCGLAGQQRAVVEGLLAYVPTSLTAAFADEADERSPQRPVTIAPLRSIDEGRAEVDSRHAEVNPDWTTGAEWSGAYPAARVDIAQEISP